MYLKMKIAIVSSSVSHMECIGFLLEILKEHEVIIIINKEFDIFNWLEYLKNIYKLNVSYNLNININDFDTVIKLTSNDNILTEEKTISLLHLKNNISINNKSNQYISLTPYIYGDNINYMFPIFNPFIFKSNLKNITFIGYYLNHNIDEDTDLFIQNNLDYQFIFITWGDNAYSNLIKHPNVKNLKNVKTNEMIEIIYSTKFILSKKYINYDRFSGQLGLAMSFQKPLIIDSKTATCYNLPGILFNKNYNEIKLNDITDEKYDNIIKDIQIFNQNCLENNKQTMTNILKNDKNTIFIS